MRAMILAAGKGERMLPLTSSTPKPLLKVAGRALIEHHLYALAGYGIREVVINVFHLGEQIVAMLGDGSRYGVNIQYSVEEQLLNTGGGIVQALPLLGSDPFLVISADIYTDFNYHILSKNISGSAHLVLVDNPMYKPQGDFGLKGNTVLPISHNPNYTYANIGIYNPRMFDYAPHGAFGLGDLLRSEVAAGNITGQYFNGLWHNVGTPSDLEMVNAISW